MSDLRFEWDQHKADNNWKKHGVSFDEAVTVFYDESALEFYDDENSEWEDRYLLLGMSSQLRILLICHCFRPDESVLRIISARRATRNESRHYWR